MHKFKVGDAVRCFYNDDGSNQYVGYEGVITDIDNYSYEGRRYPYEVNFSNSNFGEHELELIKDIELEYVNQIEEDLKKLN